MLIAGGDSWAAAGAEPEGERGVLACDRGKKLVGGEVTSLRAKARVDLFSPTRYLRVLPPSCSTRKAEGTHCGGRKGGRGGRRGKDGGTERHPSSKTRGRRERVYARSRFRGNGNGGGKPGGG
jgi:hypothetical protein